MRCAVCGVDVVTTDHACHIRWVVSDGDPLRFAQYALERSPYTRALGHSAHDIPWAWWERHGDWVTEAVMERFVAEGDYVFGEVVVLDELARDIWIEFDRT